jgi:hypothetical protein
MNATHLYEKLLIIQNAADLECPTTDLANAGMRGEIFAWRFPTRLRWQSFRDFTNSAAPQTQSLK